MWHWFGERMTTSILTRTALQDIRENAGLTLEAGRALINRSYLSELERYPVHAFAEKGLRFNAASDARIFRVERIVQDNKQSVLESTTAAYTALGAAGYSVFLILRSNGIQTDLYIGTRGARQNSRAQFRRVAAGDFQGTLLGQLISATAATRG